MSQPCYTTCLKYIPHRKHRQVAAQVLSSLVNIKSMADGGGGGDGDGDEPAM